MKKIANQQSAKREHEHKLTLVAFNEETGVGK